MSKANAAANIQKYYGIMLPQEYLDFQQAVSDMSFDLMQGETVLDWEIRFSALDDQFITNNINLVDDVNPDPLRIIPIAWSVSSGNNYMLDYRKNVDYPSVLVMDHEEAMVREDAESESETLEEAQRLLDENVKEVTANFTEFIALLKARPSLSEQLSSDDGC
ncbi:SMI1/KNR4 family protein [Paenibacillus sp. QZ-Y1]|uniref:SMI1/KNR4 family protein n=1 Tax=Paenibacillus sp. QZ-Y1 TaxID=3414511 RepID=UPI003F7965AA